MARVWTFQSKETSAPKASGRDYGFETMEGGSVIGLWISDKDRGISVYLTWQEAVDLGAMLLSAQEYT